MSARAARPAAPVPMLVTATVGFAMNVRAVRVARIFRGV